MPYSTPNHIKRYAIEDNIIKNIRNLSTKNDAITKKIIREIHILFKPGNEDYYEPVWIGNALNNNYIDYESNSDRKKTLSIEEYLNKIRSYFSKILMILKPKVNGEYA